MTSHEDGFSSKLVRVSSRFKTADSVSNTDFFTQYNSDQSTHNIYRICLTRFSCLNMFPNIDHYNNKLIYNIDGGPPITVTATIQIDQYTMDELAARITTDVSGNFTVTWNAGVQRYEFATTQNTQIIIYASSSIARFLGVTDDITITTATEFAQTYPDLGGPGHVFIESPTLARGNCLDSNSTVSGGLMSLLEVVEVGNVPWGFRVSYNANDLVSSDVDYQIPVSISIVHWKLTDGHGNTLSLPTNAEVEFIIKVFYKL